MDGTRLSIGELARRTRVSVSAIRYWEEVGLLQPAGRVSNRRQFEASAVAEVAVIRFLADVGFSLREIGQLMQARRQSADAWRGLVRQKITDLDEQLARITTARTMLSHALDCTHEDIAMCPRFRESVRSHLHDQRLHAHAHPA